MQGEILDAGVITFKTATAVSRWHFVELAASSDAVQHVGTAGNAGIGVCLDDAAVGTGVPVLIHGQGIARVVAGGTVTVGGPVKSTATGTVVDQGGTGNIIGRALASGAAGEVIPVLTGVI